MPALVCALNPSIDAEWRVAQVRWEEKNAVKSERRWAGGKGVNVARWLKHLGGQPRLLLPLGGRTGAELAAFLRDEGFAAQVVRLNQPTRVNVIVSAATGGQLRFNPPGPKLSRAEWNEILKRAERLLGQLDPRGRAQAETPHLSSRHPLPIRWGESAVSAGEGSVSEVPQPLLILSGSLPRGVPVNAYAQLIRRARRFGVKTFLDCDGAAFAAAVRARPFLVKPNEHELAQWRGRRLVEERDFLRAARALSKITGGWVLLSRGARTGFLVNARTGQRFRQTPPRVETVNTVGAGDALLAAVAREVERGAPPQDWLRRGVAVATAMTRRPPGRLFTLRSIKLPRSRS